MTRESMDGGDDGSSDQDFGYFRGWSKGFPKISSQEFRSSVECSPKHGPWSSSSRPASPAIEHALRERPSVLGRGISAPDADASLRSRPWQKKKVVAGARHSDESASSRALDSDPDFPMEAIRYAARISEEEKLLKQNPLGVIRASSNKDSSFSSKSSLSSSVNSRLRRSFGKSISQISKDVKTLGTPPNETVSPSLQDGKQAIPSDKERTDDPHNHWRTILPGRWGELRIGHKLRNGKASRRLSSSSPAVAAIATTIDSASHLQISRQESIQHPLHNPEAKIVIDDPKPSSENKDEHSEKLQLPVMKGGFYRRMKRQLGLRAKASKDSMPRGFVPIHDVSETNSLLNHASQLLSRESEQRQNRGTSSSENEALSISSRSISSSRVQRPHLQGRMSEWSASESSKSITLVPPSSTPDPELEYTGADHQRYMRVEITKPDAPTFLPSEATKIGTPPGSPRPGGPPRGFFFDQQMPSRAEPSAPWMPAKARPKANVDPVLGVERDWFRLTTDDMEEDLLECDPDVPEHLPNSPLCPRNSKHASKGRRVCLYHGRNKGEDDELLGIPETPGLYEYR